MDSINHRFFYFFIVTAFADVIFDILSSLLIMSGNPGNASLTMMTLTIFYLLQLVIPIATLFYAQTLRETSMQIIQKEMLFWLIIPAVLLLLILTNYWSGLLFSVDSNGVYTAGPLYLLMYGYALFYAVSLALLTVIHKKELSKADVAVLWEFLVIEAVSVLIQALHREYLMTGFGLCVGIMVLYLSIGNPSMSVDPITGTFNKLYFDKWYVQQQSKRKTIHILSINLPHFKQVYSTFGIAEGNRLLLEIAEALQELSPYVQVFRIAENRFYLSLQTLVDYEHTRDQIMHYFQGDFEINGKWVPFPVTICGIIHGEKLPENTFTAYVDYMFSLVKDTKQTVLIQSDDQLLNGFIYEQEVDMFLNEAVEKDLFEAYFQPIYSLSSQHFITLEALSRLWHPTLGHIPPDVFIARAEKTGHILKIGLLQLRRICRFIKEHEQIMEQIQNIKFNLSPIEILDYAHVQELIETIREYELPFSYFQFEITETVATEYSARLYDVLDLLKDTGISLCLDDFGSGYANLNTVLKLPFSCIKMDRSLLRGFSDDPQVAFFYRNLVSVLHEMNFQIVSEGVETEEETKKLQEWGVDLIQGYYFSKPLSGQQLIEMLAGSPSE